jgi:hypothetical protein
VPTPSLYELICIECCVLTIALWASKMPAWQRWIEALEQRLARWSTRPVLCMLGVVGTALLMRLSLLPLEPVQGPLFHDEFSYLLGADTFFHGRLTNPTPTVPIAFETIHVNLWPTYQTMYLPGVSLLLAAGKIFGSPWFSVLLVTALLCGVVYWMVSGWLPRTYALTAGIVALGVTETMNWWFDNYFCIALTALAMACVLGSLPRIYRRRDVLSTLPLALGLCVLVLTRPYEGACVSVPCVVALIWRLKDGGWGRIAKLAALPGAALSATFAWLLYYNWRGTGDPLLFAYTLNKKEYHITGPFLFSVKNPVPAYHLHMLRTFYTTAELSQYNFMHGHPWLFLAQKLAVYDFNFVFGLSFLLVPGLIYLVRHLQEGVIAGPLFAFAGFFMNVVLMAWAPFPQYAAPAFPLLLLIVMFGVYFARRIRFGAWNGPRVVRGLVLAELIFGFSLFGLRISYGLDFAEPQYVTKDRVRVTREVLREPGKQLCLVRYTPGHEGWQEWVFNGADLQNERLIWARSLDQKTDDAVIAAYPGRTVWLVKPDYANDLLRRYQPWTVYPLPEYRAAR